MEMRYIRQIISAALFHKHIMHIYVVVVVVFVVVVVVVVVVVAAAAAAAAVVAAVVVVMLLLKMINEVSPRLRWENKCFSVHSISVDWTYLCEIEIGMYTNGNTSAIAVLGCGCQSSRKMDRLYRT